MLVPHGTTQMSSFTIENTTLYLKIYYVISFKSFICYTYDNALWFSIIAIPKYTFIAAQFDKEVHGSYVGHSHCGITLPMAHIWAIRSRRVNHRLAVSTVIA